MRKIFVFLSLIVFVRIAQGQGNGLNQKIDFQYNGASFEKILTLFEEKTGMFFQYEASLKPTAKYYKLNYSNIPAGVILRDFLQSHGLDYATVGEQSLVLKKWVPTKAEIILSGRVSNGMTKERLVNAIIQVQGQMSPSFTNDQGIFQIRLSTGKFIYSVYYPGYITFEDTIESDQRMFFVNVSLLPEVQTMNEVLVVSDKLKPEPNVQWGKSDEFLLGKNQLDKITPILGEPDVLRIVSLNPGVVSGSEGVFGMYVRGGAADQNLILLDDVPVYNAYHLYGMFGAFNSDIVKSSKFYRGIFPADKGGRLSSVVDIQTREGSSEKLTGSFSVGILSSRIYLGGPINKGKTTYSLAFRRSFFDYLVQPIGSALQFGNLSLVNKYFFWDMNAKLTHRFSEKSRLTLSVYSGLDYSGFLDPKSYELSYGRKQTVSNNDITQWGNRFLSLRWDIMPTTTSSFSLRAYYTNYSYNHSHSYSNKIESETGVLLNENSKYTLSNGLEDFELSMHFKKQVTSNFNFKLGTGSILHTFIPNIRSLETLQDSIKLKFNYQDQKTLTPEIFSYASIEWHHRKLGFYDFGIRGVYYGLGFGQYYVLPEPRFSARYVMGKQSWLKISASQTRQFFHQLNNLTMGLPSDLWVPSNTLFQPARANQFSIGFTKLFIDYQFSTEIFIKRFNNILEYNDNAIYVTSSQDWTSSVLSGNGKSSGWECLLEKNKGKLTGWISYTLLYSSRQFEGLNGGQEFPSRYDRRHNIYVVGSYKLNSNWNLSATWIYNSGFAYTLPIGIYPSISSNDPSRDVYIYGSRNNKRALDNHRLDISASYTSNSKKVILENKKSFKKILTFGIYNVYNRHNPFYMTLGTSNDGSRRLFQVSLLPFMPFISYQLVF